MHEIQESMSTCLCNSQDRHLLHEHVMITDSASLILTCLPGFLALVIHRELCTQKVGPHFAGKVGAEAGSVLLVKGQDIVGALALLALAGGHEEVGTGLHEEAVLGVQLARLVPHYAALHCRLSAACQHQESPAQGGSSNISQVLLTCSTHSMTGDHLENISVNQISC